MPSLKSLLTPFVLTLTIVCCLHWLLPAQAAPTQVIQPAGRWYFDYLQFDVNLLDSGPDRLTAQLSGATLETDPAMLAPLPFNTAAVRFDGDSDYVYLNAAADDALNADEKLTIAAWVYPEQHTKPESIIVNKEGEYEIAITPDGFVKWAIANASPGWRWIETDGQLPFDTWSHVAFVYSATDNVADVYVNGVIVNNIDFSGPAFGAIGDSELDQNQVRIGWRAGVLQSEWKGMIDEVHIYLDALSAEQIADLVSGEQRGCTVSADYATIHDAVTDKACQSVAIPTGTYTESSIEVTHDIDIRGADRANTILQSTAQPQIFAVPPVVSATISELTLQADPAQAQPEPDSQDPNSMTSSDAMTRGGSVGAISNDGKLVVTNVNFANNSASVGAGIYNRGLLTVSNSAFTNNRGFTGGGAIYNVSTAKTWISDSSFTDNEAFNDGGAIYNDGELTVTRSQFTDNSVSDGLHGGAIWSKGSASIRDSLFSSNFALRGGGIYGDGTVTIRNSTFDNNLAASGSFNDGAGGAVYVNGGIAQLFDSVFINNRAKGGSGRGGALYNRGTMSVVRSTIAHNEASGGPGFGGGIYNFHRLIVELSVIHDNEVSGFGGGIFNMGEADVRNSTLSGNTNESTLVSYGGAIANEKVLRLNHTTIVNNSAELGAGIASKDEATVTTTLGSTLVNQNSGGGSDLDLYAFSNGSDVDSFVGEGYNLFGTLGNGIAIGGDGNIFNNSSQVEPLADYGGPTWTHALLADSDAVDAIPASSCGDDETDQRGAMRLFGAGCDIGAYEFGSAVSRLFLPLLVR